MPMIDPTPLTWCDVCETWTADTDAHSCEGMLARREDIALNAAKRHDRKKAHVTEYNRHVRLKRQERRSQ